MELLGYFMTTSTYCHETIFILYWRKKYKDNALQYPSFPKKKIVNSDSSWIQRNNGSKYLQGLSSGIRLWILICSVSSSIKPHVIFTWGPTRFLHANFHFSVHCLVLFPHALMLLVASSSDIVIPMENRNCSHYCPCQNISTYVTLSQLDGRLEGMGNSYSLMV